MPNPSAVELTTAIPSSLPRLLSLFGTLNSYAAKMAATAKPIKENTTANTTKLEADTGGVYEFEVIVKDFY